MLQCTADLLEAADLAVVHERPGAGDEGVAVHAAGGAAGRGAHMGQEQPGFYLTAKALQIGIRPSRQDVAVKAGLRPVAIPGHAKAIGIGRRFRFLRTMALNDQRMWRCGDDVFQEDRIAKIGGPSAHCPVIPSVHAFSSANEPLAIRRAPRMTGGRFGVLTLRLCFADHLPEVSRRGPIGTWLAQTAGYWCRLSSW